jgi:hypothetical protein
MQSLLLSLPADERFPVGQLEQPFEREVARPAPYLLAAQFVHELDAVTSYLPAAQLTHPDPEEEILPAGQARHGDACLA